MKKYIILSILLIASVVFAHDFAPTTFTRYVTTKTPQTHVVTGAKKVSINSNVAAFYSYTTVTGTGSTSNRFPLKADTDTIITIPQDSQARRLTLSGYSTASTIIHVSEER